MELKEVYAITIGFVWVLNNYKQARVHVDICNCRRGRGFEPLRSMHFHWTKVVLTWTEDKIFILF